MFGPDLSKWPAWAVDSLTVVETERMKLEAAHIRTENKDRAMEQRRRERS